MTRVCVATSAGRRDTSPGTAPTSSTGTGGPPALWRGGGAGTGPLAGGAEAGAGGADTGADHEGWHPSLSRTPLSLVEC